MKSIIILSLWGGILLSGWTQADFSYVPLKPQSALPETYFSKSEATIDALIRTQDVLNENDARQLYSETNNLIKRLFMNGYVLYDSPLTAYVRKVATETFSNNPLALNGITFYVATFQEANAISLADGTIFINIGLLSVLENDAQLGFVLAHEVGHYNKRHILKAYLKRQTLKKQSEDTEKEKVKYLTLLHSREHETEADGYGLSIVSRSIFDARQAASALTSIEREDTALSPVKQDLYNLLQSEYFTLDSSLVKFTQKFKTINSSEKHSKHSIFRGDPDNLRTHLGVEKRKDAIGEILNSMDYSPTGKEAFLSENEFTYIKRVALFELANYAYENKKFFLSMAIAGELIKQFPENRFLKTLILKSIYWTAYYKDTNSLNHMETDIPIYNRAQYWLIAKMMNKAESGTVKKMAYGYAKKNQENMAGDDEFSYYLALSVEQYLGKETANIFYMQYQHKFPEGNYIHQVNEKL